ncbi:MAG: hypothetical protein FIA82_08145 [Melioribacter sp.]|nr:hypothetical protein [Melioribacter sp.]
MADEVKEILLKLKIDNKEYQATIDVSKGKLVELVKLIDPLEQKFESAYKKITAELSKYNSANTQSIETLTNWIRTQNISVDEIERAITQLTTETKQIDVNSAAWQKSMAVVENLRGAHGKLITGYDQTTQAQRQMTGGVNSMNMAIGQFGFLVGDADMFMVNFRMGMMSIANNVPMVIQFMQYAKQEAAGLNMTLGQAFFQSIKGPGGLLLGANAAMFAMNILAGAFSDTTEEVKKHEDEIDKLKQKYQELSKTTLESMKVQMDAEIFQLENKGGLGARSKGDALLQWITGSSLSDAEKDRLKLLYDQRAAIIGQVEATGELDNLKKRIQENEKAYYGVSEANLNTQYRYLREFLDDKGWAATAENARKLLKEWIDADKAYLKDLDKLNDDSDKKQKRFAEEKSKTLLGITQDELIAGAEKELRSKDYRELLELDETAQNNYLEFLQTFHNIKTETELKGFNAMKDTMEKTLKMIEDELKKREDLGDKEMDEIRKKIAAKIKAREDEWRYEEEQKKWQRESTYKYETDPFEQKKKELDAEEETSIERAQIFGATEEQITNIKAYYAKQREALEQQSAFAQLNIWQQQLSGLSKLFGKHTAAYKILALSVLGLETAKQMSAALSPPPVGLGPLTGYALWPVITANAGIQAATILQTKTDMPGYLEGGRLPFGKSGFVEGAHDEIIAPEKNFIQVVNDLIYRGQIAAMTGGPSGSGSSSDFNNVTNRLERIENLLEKNLSKPSRAFIVQEDFNNGFNQADFEARKNM